MKIILVSVLACKNVINQLFHHNIQKLVNYSFMQKNVCLTEVELGFEV